MNMQATSTASRKLRASGIIRCASSGVDVSRRQRTKVPMPDQQAVVHLDHRLVVAHCHHTSPQALRSWSIPRA
jgi:hypothetical protein